MATVTFTADDTVLNLYVQAACALYNYQPTINGTDNPQTPAQFASQKVVDFCKEVTAGYQASVAAEQARQAAITAVKAQIDATPISVTVS